MVLYISFRTPYAIIKSQPHAAAPPQGPTKAAATKTPQYLLGARALSSSFSLCVVPFSPLAPVRLCLKEGGIGQNSLCRQRSTPYNAHDFGAAPTHLIAYMYHAVHPFQHNCPTTTPTSTLSNNTTRPETVCVGSAFSNLLFDY